MHLPSLRGEQDTGVDKALRVVDGAIYVAKAAPLGTAVKVCVGLSFLAAEMRSLAITEALLQWRMTIYRCS